ncbi:uncharacterized protein FFFS_09029 [Fusarium fujikuroi]|nr:uncharacterized protein FFFS_09029 [Fusarium fujikuroi]
MTPDASAAAAALASAPSSSPATPWCGLPKPKRLPKSKHYDNELSWIHAERARLAACLEEVDIFCQVDAKSIAVLDDEIAVCTRRDLHWECIADKYQVLKKEAEAQAGAAASDAEQKSLEEEAAAATDETEGLEPNTSNEDADSINTMNNDIAKLKQQGAEEAFGVSSEDFLQENLSAAAGGAEAEGVAPTFE